MPQQSSRIKDLTGTEFGLSKVVSLKTPGGSGKHAIWHCVCACGKPHAKSSGYIRGVLNNREGYRGSCGARCPKMLAERDTTPKNGPVSHTRNLAGVEFGFSTVVDLNTPGASGRHAVWNCLCICGAPHTKNSSQISNTIKGKPKHYGSCSTWCARERIKRSWIQDHIEELEILAEELEVKWGVEIGIGTLKQAQESNWTHYLTGDGCANGRVDAKAIHRRQCMQCRKDERMLPASRERSRQWRLDNPIRYKQSMDDYYAANAEVIRARSRQWTQDNPERAREQTRAVRATPEGRLIHNIRNRLNKILNRINVVKDSTTLDLLGCDAAFAKEHLEKQFTEGMTWENYGDWDIDHIRPCASFDLTDPEQQREAFHFSNLQPLWSTPEKALKHGVHVEYSETNITKGSLYEGERHHHGK